MTSPTLSGGEWIKVKTQLDNQLFNQLLKTVATIRAIKSYHKVKVSRDHQASEAAIQHAITNCIYFTIYVFFL